MTVNLCKSNNQFIHLRVRTNQNQEYLFTAVYATPNENDKKLLWEELSNISTTANDLWLLEGDFNDIAASTEKKGGLQPSQSRCALFRNRIKNCNLNDLEAKSPNFTWRGPIFHGGQRIYEKLDRALSNDNWRWCFPDAIVKVLVRVEFSDHHPILVVPTMDIHNKPNKPFRFENAWLLNNSYHDMLQQVWNNDYSMTRNLKNTRDGIKDWKYDTFDEVEGKKAELMRRLNGIQKNL
ncbi:uncharacterized protein LOC131613470 [Vicia villosa]|uniref:uncharacterized protein LOC131613470 n=1 Tax=Vicia villosa TaxID=3911 RepID=UPI00273AB87D|nr:uncharacterized protein LOC131613470 [Vicia villosa]